MPTLIRFVLALALLAGAAAAGIVALATLVEPEMRQRTVDVPIPPHP